MTVRNYSSISQETSLTSALNSSATTMVVSSSSGLLGGVTIASGQTFTVVIDPDTALEEIVDVVYPSTSGSNTLTITRAVESGSVAIAHSAGAKVRHMAIGRDFRDSNTHIEATVAHGATGAIVGTTNTQTLTNKTLTSPVVTGLTLNDSSIVFEGATADAFETTLTVTDPTADRTITFPNVTGTVAILDATQTLSNKTLGSALAAGTNKITGLGDPTSAQDAATKNYVDTGATSQVVAAAASATAASSSASAASTSATNASNSASAASTSASNASTSASAASTSATNAESSATSATASATTATTQATNASSSATSAAASAALLTDSSTQISFQVFG